MFQYHTPCQRASCDRADNIAAQTTRLWSHRTDHNVFAEGRQRRLRGVKLVAELQPEAMRLSRPTRRMLFGGWSRNGTG